MAVEAVKLAKSYTDNVDLAVANALAGLQNGARQVEATINGIGEQGLRGWPE